MSVNLKYILIFEKKLSEESSRWEDSINNVKKMLEDTNKQRETDREFWENKSKLLTKQFEELGSAKESLDKEKALLTQRLNEEKQNLEKISKVFLLYSFCLDVI